MKWPLVAAMASLWLQDQGALPLRYRPEQNVLQLNIGRLGSVAIDSQFTYVGGDRFILRGSADAEQHVFAAVDSSGVLRSFFWVQVEELLPQRPGAYDYQTDAAVGHQGFELRSNTRQYTTPPEPGSDRARAFAILERHGYSVPLGSTRVRLIYLPERNARREVMLIYVTVPNAANSADRALSALTLRGR